MFILSLRLKCNYGEILVKVEQHDRAVMERVPQVTLLPGAIPEIVASVADTGELAISDRYGLMAAVLNGSLSEEEMRAVDRLLRAVARGRVRFNHKIV